MAGEVIDRYIHDVHQHLQLTGAYRRRVLDELCDHLYQACADGEAEGLSPNEATERAITSLGPPIEVAGRFTPAPTRRTRLLAILAAVGAAIALGTIPVTNELHAEGERLGTDVRYSLAWTTGIVATLAVGGLLIAVAQRLGGRRLTRGATLVSAAVGLAAIGAFHLANDGTLDSGPGPDPWRVVALIAGAAACGLVVATVHKAAPALAGPAIGTLAALLLLTIHYTVLEEQGPAALVGLVAMALAWLWAIATLVWERPLA